MLRDAACRCVLRGPVQIRLCGVNLISSYPLSDEAAHENSFTSTNCTPEFVIWGIRPECHLYCTCIYRGRNKPAPPCVPDLTMCTRPHHVYQTSPCVPDLTLCTRPHHVYQTSPCVPDLTMCTRPHPVYQASPCVPGLTVCTTLTLCTCLTLLRELQRPRVVWQREVRQRFLLVHCAAEFGNPFKKESSLSVVTGVCVQDLH